MLQLWMSLSLARLSCALVCWVPETLKFVAGLINHRVKMDYVSGPYFQKLFVCSLKLALGSRNQVLRVSVNFTGKTTLVD